MVKQDEIPTTKVEVNPDPNFNHIVELLKNVQPGEEIVISGISGGFPGANDVHEFRDNLFNKFEMPDESRWKNFTHPELPIRSGMIPNIEKYDAGYFGVHARQADSTEASGRILKQKTVEAILDAGLHPSDLENTNTGVYVGCCSCETKKTLSLENLKSHSYSWTGSAKSMQPHRLSYFLKLKGPSVGLDTACSSSLFALEHAFKALLLGEIDNAIVAGTNLCLHPFVSLQFARLGVLSMDGSCKVFDKTGNGYVRSEAAGVVLLQKLKNAKRSYAQVIHAKTNCDGYKEQGITYPSGDAQTALMSEFYKECNISPSSLSYLEAHGTGTSVGDPEECLAIDAVLTRNRKLPLLVGSVKSNIGHSEPASGTSSIIKCILAFETGFIPPNIHYTAPRDEIKGLVEGRMKVIVDKTRFDDNRGLAAMNNFGFGGANCHALLRWNSKQKIENGLPKDSLPRLVCVSGRTEHAITSLLNELKDNEFDAEHIYLLHNIFRKNIQNNIYRGYIIVSKSGEITRSLRFFSGHDMPLYFTFGELDNWCEIGNNLMVLPAFAASIQRIQKLLSGKGIDLPNILLDKIHDKKTIHILECVAVQIGIIDILNLLEVRPTDCIGFSIGALSAAYCDGSLTLEETVNCAFVMNEQLNMMLNKSKHDIIQVNHATNGSNVTNGGATVVNSNRTKLGNNVTNGNAAVLNGTDKKLGNHVTNGDAAVLNGNNTKLGNGVTNGDASVAFNGNDTKLDKLRLALKTQNIKNIQTHLRNSLSKILGDEELYSNKRVKNKYRSADYLINALTDNVSQDSIKMKLCSVVFQISTDCTHEDDANVISFATARRRNYLVAVLESLGSLYECGYNPQLDKLYPTIDLPVSRGTRMISPYIKWNHNRDWFVPHHYSGVKEEMCARRTFKLQFTNQPWSFLTGHIVDGRNLFPATGYLYLVWETLASLSNSSVIITTVSFEDCKFIRAVTIPNKSDLEFSVTIQRGTGKFEVIEGESAVVTGRISYEFNELEDITSSYPAGLPDTVALPLKKRDVYKELRLRGYNYRGKFRAIRECDNSASIAHIKWNTNWITFMDNMLQMKILQLDTRRLYVPTYIRKLTIEPRKHLAWINDKYGSEDKTPCLPVFNDRSTGIISCGYIKIWGLTAKTISRRKYLGIPVLETYKFIPNVASLETHVSVRVIMQIILENMLAYNVKVIELIDNYSEEDSLLTPIILTVLEDQPLVQSSVKILSKTPLDVSSIEVEDKQLNTETDCSLVIGTNILGRPEILNEAFESLKEKGFIISRESRDFDVLTTKHLAIEVITIHKTATDCLVLFQKLSPLNKSVTLQINNSKEFSWIPKLKETIERMGNNDIVIYSGNDPNSGILGLVNCLRREPSGRNVRCMFVMDTNKKLVPSEQQINAQLRKNMAVNVYKNGQWGTYRHVLLDQLSEEESEHCFANITSIGDLSSIKWVKGPLCHNKVLASGNILAYTYYAALNFKDVMTALGKIDIDVMNQDRREQECVLGLEYAGRDENGNRIMGIVSIGALSTLVVIDPTLTFKIPDTWSFADGATVPVVYLTVIYALVVRGEMKRGESILIHSGTGGVGLAAIRMALYHGCKVFATVGTQEKREFLKKEFPQLNDDHIGNSRDESFEQMINKATNGQGVDMVLNSLAEDKLFASVRCLATGGRFLEIGKYDLANNNKLNLLLLKKNACYLGVMVDMLIKETPQKKRVMFKLMNEGIQSGAIQPLKKTIFKFNEIERAFRFMATGKHMGKVLIETRNPENETTSLGPEQIQKFPGLPRYLCDPEMVYIIAGGLGGFGLELADWLVLRGATKLVLTSRKGISTGYQHFRIRIWESYGTVVKISKSDITTKSGCQELIEESQKLGAIDAIFNLAVILKDSVFENQTAESFCTAFAPKATATQYLDELSRKYCPSLRQFVIFSSVSCGRGNAGQTNYGMANSVMERICEQRKEDGYPALAIEWGAIGEVGLVAEMQEEHTELAIGGTLQQRISNCLSVLDDFLLQNVETIVSSMVVAEKQGGAGTAKTIMDAVVNILGVDIKTVSVNSTLAELGMDSMTAMEIKQVLERDFDVALTAKDMRTVTLARLQDIQTERETADQEVVKVTHIKFGLDTIFRLMGPECDSRLLHKRLESNIDESAPAPKLIMFPGIEGFARIYEPLAVHLNAHAVCVQYNYYSKSNDTGIICTVNSLIPVIEKYITKDEPFKFIAYSYGVIIALEVVSILESKGYVGSIICLDGSPSLFKEMSNLMNTLSDEDLQCTVVYQIIYLLKSNDEVSNYKAKIFDCKNWNERLDLLIEITKELPQFSDSYRRVVTDGLYKRLKDLITYEPSYGKLKAKAKLFKAERATIQNFPDDYEISNVFEDPVEIQTFAGDHTTLLDNDMLIDTINLFISRQ